MLTRKAFLKGIGVTALLGGMRPAWAADGDRALLAGVAKVALTPAAGDLAALARADRRLDGTVAQDIFARIIVLANRAGERLLLVAADLPAIPGADDLVRRIAATHRIDQAACVLAVTGNRQADALVVTRSVRSAMHDRIAAGVGAALGALRPARMAFARTTSNINAPFGRITPAGLAIMPDFANFADKELAILRIDDAAGKPMALFVNYAMQATMMQACSRRLSGDIAGSIAAYVERRLGCLCAWSMGAAADSYPLTIGAVENPVYGPGGKLTIERQALSEDVVDRLCHYLTATQGLDILGAQAAMTRFADTFTLRAGVREVPATGRDGTIRHRLHLAVMNEDIAFAGVNGLPSAGLGKLVKDALPFRSMILAAEGDSIGIVVDRASDPAGLAGTRSVAADPSETEKIYVDGFTRLAARRAAGGLTMGTLHAAAARRRITPGDALRALWNRSAAKPFSAPNGDIYVQALVFSDLAGRTVVHLGGDIIMTLDPAIRTRIAQEFKVKESCIFFSCTHNHMVPSPSARDGPASMFGGGAGMTQWSELITSAALDALREAMATLRPARMGAGHGVSGTSVNREWDTPVGSLGTGDRNGDTMHQQSVLRVDELGGKPIAVLVNGNCHAGSFFGGSVGLDHRITGGDVAGFVSTFLGDAIGGGIVPIWAIGGAGDQNTYFHSGMMWPWVDDKGGFVQETYVMKDADAIALARNAATIQCLEVLAIYHAITEFSDGFDLKTGITYRKVPRVRDTRPPPGGAPGGPMAPPPAPGGAPAMEEATLRFYLIALNGIAFAGANAESFIALKRGALAVLPYDETFWIDMNFDATGFAGYVPGPRYDPHYDAGRRHNLQGQIMPYNGNDALRLYCDGMDELVRTIA